MYGFQNSEEVSQNGSTGGKFGLNSGALVTKFEFNPNGGKDSTPQDCLDFTVQIGEKEFRQRFFPFTKTFKGGAEITDPTNEDFKSGLALYLAALTDIVVCFVPETTLKTALAQPIADFKGYAETLVRLVKSNPQWDKTKVDVFLQYSWSIKNSNDKTYLELPNNVKHGSYIVPTQGVGFKLVDGESIKYVNEAGALHPIKRSTWFAESAFANQQVTETSSTASSMNSGATAGGDW